MSKFEEGYNEGEEEIKRTRLEGALQADSVAKRMQPAALSKHVQRSICGFIISYFMYAAKPITINQEAIR
ncbi:hypothetical protein [Paenibacillus sp. BC26]|uniref:hypothetical protein n=1 Tax=Paenibacillus sp. BC26 TaxID=1881032 RepID=UPI000B89C1E9|nr:hypothetical protein [Paenibacillus sp. BC26]